MIKQSIKYFFSLMLGLLLLGGSGLLHAHKYQDFTNYSPVKAFNVEAIGSLDLQHAPKFVLNDSKDDFNTDAEEIEEEDDKSSTLKKSLSRSYYLATHPHDLLSVYKHFSYFLVNKKYVKLQAFRI